MLNKLFIFFFLMLGLLSVSSAEENFIARKDLQAFIQSMVEKHHFKKKYLTQLFSEVKIRPQIIQHINRPLESEPWKYYQLLFITPYNVEEGVKFWNKYSKTLKKAENLYGVPAAIIVATIGIETRYGQRKGDFRVIDSLTNIAFSDSHRAGFFKKELEEFLLLTREHHLSPLKMMGSYAGAIGIPQFMPSSYRYYAVNFSKSGQADLVNNEIDVIGSIANYYKRNGWKTGTPIAIRAHQLGKRYNFLKRKNELMQPFTIGNAIKVGLIPKNTQVNEDIAVKVIELKNKYSKEYWLGFHNFDVIKRYNASDLYAMAVFQLSHLIEAKQGKLAHGKH